jgi:hypothetical protein
MAKSKSTAGASAPSQPLTLSRADLRVGASAGAGLSLAQFMHDDELPEGVVVKTFAPLVKLKQFPTGKWLSGRFVGLFPIPPKKADQKPGVGIELLPNGSEKPFALPGCATLKMGLTISQDKGGVWISPNIGRTVSVKLHPDKIVSAEEGKNDSWDFSVAIHPAAPTV